MKTWLKGGIIGVIAHVVYFMIFLPWIFSNGGESLMLWIFAYTEMLPGWLVLLPLESFIENNFVLGSFIIGFVVSIYWFIIGALIGYIYDKIKNK